MMDKGKFLFLLLLAGCSSGCWDFHDVEKLAFITIIGIDRPSPEKVKVSLQIPIIQNTLPPVAGGEGESKKFYDVTTTAQTVNQAFDLLGMETYRTLAIFQTKSIVIGEAAARQDLYSVLDLFARTAQAPLQALVFIADGVGVEDIIQMPIDQMLLPGLALVWAAEAIDKYDRAYFIPIWQFHQKLIHESKDTYAPLLGIAPDRQQHIFSGLALFDEERLAGKLNGVETEMFGLLTGLIQSGLLSLQLRDNTQITLRNVQAKPRIKVRIRDGQPFFDIQVRIRGSLSELTGHRPAQTPEKVTVYQQDIARILEQRLTKVIAKIQQFKADVLDFGEEFRVQHQAIWQKTDWKKIYPTVDFRVGVEVKILSDGRFRY